jgi:hypothetical protein
VAAIIGAIVLGCGDDGRPLTLDGASSRPIPYYPRHSHFFGSYAAREDVSDSRLGPDEYPTIDEASADSDSAAPVPAGSPWDVLPGVTPREWRYIVIHHSATEEGSAAAFRRFHRRKGWDDLAYHFVIGNGQGAADGAVEIGNRWMGQRVGAHARQREYNEYGIGICLVGNFEFLRPTAKQMASLRELIAFLTSRFGIEPKNVVRHRDVSTTKCPGRRFPWPVVHAPEDSGATQ